MHTPFLYTNRLQWFLVSPLRQYLRRNQSEWPRRIFLFLFPLGVAYSLVAYLVLTPLRLLNAFYFDIALFWSVSLRDGIVDLLYPGYKEPTRWKNALRWISLFPKRLAKFLVRYAQVVFQGIMMVGFDTVWPTLTLFHGTDRSIAEAIAGTGLWKAGSGDFAGTGIYFGLEPEIAEHYARSKPSPLVVVARVTLAPCRPVATLPVELRQKIGHWAGDEISQGVRFPWTSLEHWREDRNWYEFVLLLRSKFSLVSPWRIRPVCIVGPEVPERVTGGLAIWPKTRRGWRLLGGTHLALLALLGLFTFVPFRFPILSKPGLALANPSLPSLENVSLPMGDSILKLVRQSANSKEESQMAGCPGAPTIRLQVGQHACVADLEGQLLRLRSKPLIQQGNVIRRIHSGVQLKILDGPVCANRYTWWQVETGNGLTGWVAEGSQQGYFLEQCR